MNRAVSPAKSISGSLRIPGDKSVSHRYAILGSIAEGYTKIHNYSSGSDCASTLNCLRAMGITIEHQDTLVTIKGVGLNGLQKPMEELDAGNSGSTIRMLSGILAGQKFKTVIKGDESLARRPMQRIITPLEQMGATIEATGKNFPPLCIQGGTLRPIDHSPVIPSAQVKTAVLFAGLYAKGKTVVRELLPTRNHTEIALLQFGAKIKIQEGVTEVDGHPTLMGREMHVPSDMSSAAFFIAAALLLPGSHLVLEDVGINPTRIVLLDVLQQMGADIKVLRKRVSCGETIGDLEVRNFENNTTNALQGGLIEGATTAAVIDEIPILAVLGAASKNGLIVKDAKELRVKESDRIRTVAENLKRMGVSTEVFSDGIKISGRNRFQAAEFDSFGDHRIAMAFAVAALRAEKPCSMINAEAAAVSFPEFFDLLNLAVGT